MPIVRGLDLCHQGITEPLISWKEIAPIFVTYFKLWKRSTAAPEGRIRLFLREVRKSLDSTLLVYPLPSAWKVGAAFVDLDLMLFDPVSIREVWIMDSEFVNL